MANEKLRRPDGAQTKSAILTARTIDRRLSQVISSEPQLQLQVTDAAREFADRRLEQALEAMDIEHINKAKQGIRVQLLRDAGIDSVFQVSRMSEAEICRIDGIGEQTARKILETVQQIKENTAATLRMRIRVDNADRTDTALIRALYILIHTRQPRKVCQRIYKEHHKPLENELLWAEKSLNGLGWLFQSRSNKEQMVIAVDNIRFRLEGEFGRQSAIAAFDRALNADDESCRNDFVQRSPDYYSELEALGIVWDTSEAAPGGLPAQLAAEVEARGVDLKHLKAKLRQYQLFGTKYVLHQKHSLLGDEMGLGKTVQAIAAMCALKAEGKTHFMVVCPASVLVNWCREVQKFSGLSVTKIHGNDTEALNRWLETGDVAVTTYESISRFQLPPEFEISMVVTDEAHYVKNPQAQRTKALRSLLRQTEFVLFMSGTPLENKVEEMCFLVGCLNKGIADELEKVKFLSTAEQFRQQLAPVYLRRTREDVLQELPDLIEKEQWCGMGKSEKDAYFDAVMSGNFMAIRQVSWQVYDLKDSAKAQRLLEICDQAAEQGRKVIVFSFFRTTLRKVEQLLEGRCTEPITGAVSPARRQEIVDEFSRSETGTVLLSQVQAGGTGLNIQSASVIIFCEPQIKPSIENQAIARAYRMGQVRDVLVYRLLTEDSIDEQIMELLKDKQNLFDNFADESVVGEESLKPTEKALITKMIGQEQKRLQLEAPAGSGEVLCLPPSNLEGGDPPSPEAEENGTVE